MKRRKARNLHTVYSSEHGRMCPACEQPMGRCRCRKTSPVPQGDGIVRVSRETKGRKGKGVTRITGIPLDADELGKLARELKQKCGSGGTVKEGAIEIQGDHPTLLVDLLTEKGWKVKRAGG